MSYEDKIISKCFTLLNDAITKHEIKQRETGRVSMRYDYSGAYEPVIDDLKWYREYWRIQYRDNSAHMNIGQFIEDACWKTGNVGRAAELYDEYDREGKAYVESLKPIDEKYYFKDDKYRYIQRYIYSNGEVWEFEVNLGIPEKITPERIAVNIAGAYTKDMQETMLRSLDSPADREEIMMKAKRKKMINDLIQSNREALESLVRTQIDSFNSQIDGLNTKKQEFQSHIDSQLKEAMKGGANSLFILSAIGIFAINETNKYIEKEKSKTEKNQSKQKELEDIKRKLEINNDAIELLLKTEKEEEETLRVNFSIIKKISIEEKGSPDDKIKKAIDHEVEREKTKLIQNGVENFNQYKDYIFEMSKQNIDEIKKYEEMRKTALDSVKTRTESAKAGDEKERLDLLRLKAIEEAQIKREQEVEAIKNAEKQKRAHEKEMEKLRQEESLIKKKALARLEKLMRQDYHSTTQNKAEWRESDKIVQESNERFRKEQEKIKIDESLSPEERSRIAKQERIKKAKVEESQREFIARQKEGQEFKLREVNNDLAFGSSSNYIALDRGSGKILHYKNGGSKTETRNMKLSDIFRFGDGAGANLIRKLSEYDTTNGIVATQNGNYSSDLENLKAQAIEILKFQAKGIESPTTSAVSPGRRTSAGYQAQTTSAVPPVPTTSAGSPVKTTSAGSFSERTSAVPFGERTSAVSPGERTPAIAFLDALGFSNRGNAVEISSAPPSLVSPNYGSNPLSPEASLSNISKKLQKPSPPPASAQLNTTQSDPAQPALNKPVPTPPQSDPDQSAPASTTPTRSLLASTSSAQSDPASPPQTPLSQASSSSALSRASTVMGNSTPEEEQKKPNIQDIKEILLEEKTLSQKILESPLFNNPFTRTALQFGKIFSPKLNIFRLNQPQLSKDAISRLSETQNFPDNTDQATRANPSQEQGKPSQGQGNASQGQQASLLKNQDSSSLSEEQLSYKLNELHQDLSGLLKSGNFDKDQAFSPEKLLKTINDIEIAFKNYKPATGSENTADHLKYQLSKLVIQHKELIHKFLDKEIENQIGLLRKKGYELTNSNNIADLLKDNPTNYRQDILFKPLLKLGKKIYEYEKFTKEYETKNSQAQEPAKPSSSPENPSLFQRISSGILKAPS